MGTLASELGPYVERLTGGPRIDAAANVPAGVVRFMRRRLSWNVLAVVEHDERRRAADTEHYRLARQLHRTLISLDRDDRTDPVNGVAPLAGQKLDIHPAWCPPGAPDP